MTTDIMQAKRQLKQAGVSNASGDAQCAMYAELISTVHGGKDSIYYAYLQKAPDRLSAAKRLLESRAAAWDVLMGLD